MIRALLNPRLTDEQFYAFICEKKLQFIQVFWYCLWTTYFYF